MFLSDSAYILKLVSTFSVLLPLFLGFRYWKRFQLPIRWFLLFLVFGFAVDLSGWYFYLTVDIEGSWMSRYLYELVESLFFTWLIYVTSNKASIKSICRVAIPVLAILWIVSTWNRDWLALYKILTQVSLSFLSGFVILELVERKQSKFLPLEFWLAVGIFFYNFCTFFIMGLINTEAGIRIWWMQNSINITTNLIYATGLWLFRGVISLPLRPQGRDSKTNQQNT